MSDLSKDPRWQRFNDTGYECPCCGESFSGVFDLSFDHPQPWPHAKLAESSEDTLIVGDDMLSSDYCICDEHKFVRCVMELPIIGSEQRFAFGAWGSLHPDNFKAYLQAVEDNAEEQFEGCFSWLTNELPGFWDLGPVACNFKPNKPSLRPKLFAQNGPLKNAQDNGITFDQLLDIYREAGNDIRPHLMQS